MARKKRKTKWIQKAVPPSRRGVFAAKAKRAGKSVQAYASYILSHKSKFSAKTVKQATFAKRAKKGF